MARPNITVMHISRAVCDCGWSFESGSRDDTWHATIDHWQAGCDAPLACPDCGGSATYRQPSRTPPTTRCLDCGEVKEMYPQWQMGPDGRFGTICHDCETRRRTPATQHAAHDTPQEPSQTPSSSE